ncbi:MAG: hypothetical protein BWY32_03486 [bacterium ADurb.Bin243]|nr:MAG: hypothetical protein BWY32_03486 [bacterium ADurb.Bin243]
MVWRGRLYFELVALDEARVAVVYEIAFHSEYRLDVIAFSGVVKIRETLDHAMIGERYRLMFPVGGELDEIGYFRHAVEGRHFRVSVQLDSFALGLVFALFKLALVYVVYHHYHVFGVFVEFYASKSAHYHARF